MEAQVGVLEAGALRGEVADEHTLAHEVREQRGRGGLTPQLHHDAVPALATPDDPGAPIGALPRQVDSQDQIAAPLVAAVWDRLVGARLVADA